MTTEAYVHVVPQNDESDSWCLSVGYGGTLAQIRICGALSRRGTSHARLAFELARLGEALAWIASEPRAIRWEHPEEMRRKPPRRAGASASGASKKAR